MLAEAAQPAAVADADVLGRDRLEETAQLVVRVGRSGAVALVSFRRGTGDACGDGLGRPVVCRALADAVYQRCHCPQRQQDAVRAQ